MAGFDFAGILILIDKKPISNANPGSLQGTNVIYLTIY